MPLPALLAATLAAATPQPVIVGRLERPVLAMAFAGADHVLLLEDDRLSLWRIAAGAVTLTSTLETPRPVEPVRHAGGVIHAPDGDGGAWVLGSGWSEAILVRVDDGRLSRGESAAAALPWPGAPGGVRFRAGTNILEGKIAGLAEGPYVALSSDGRAAVGVDARLRLPRPDNASPTTPTASLSAGSALAHPWSDVLVASAAVADAPDALLVVRLGSVPRVVARVEVHGLIQALTVKTEGATAIVLAAIQDASGHALVRVDLRRPTGASP